mgnify:CR=1 FL=1
MLETFQASDSKLPNDLHPVYAIGYSNELSISIGGAVGGII